MPGPAPPVVDGLQIDQALDFQRRFGRLQHVAWSLLLLAPVAAIAGLFGDGLWSDTTRGGRAAGVTVTYDRVARMSAATSLEIAPVPAGGTARVAISAAFLDRYAVEEIRPAPERTAAEPGVVVFLFAGRTGGRVRFTLRPEAVGSSRATVTGVAGSGVRFRQLVLP